MKRSRGRIVQVLGLLALFAVLPSIVGFKWMAARSGDGDASIAIVLVLAGLFAVTLLWLHRATRR